MPSPLLKSIGQRLLVRGPGPSGPHSEFPATVAVAPELRHRGPSIGWPAGGQGLEKRLHTPQRCPVRAQPGLAPAPVSAPASTPTPACDDDAGAGPESDFAADSLPPADADDGRGSATLLKLGRYEVKGLLGKGGLSQVHAAWDPVLSRPVAVKTLQLQTDPELQQLLRQHILNEARASAALNHRHIVTVYDAGLSAHGVYIAMEKLRGRDLRQALAQGWRPAPWQAAQLARRVADALAYAHSRGVVHCDIKPANIFLDHRDRPKVLDFGIARVAQDRLQGERPDLQHRHWSGPPAERAREEPLMGTPHYLSPEQMRSGRADPRTDIHALGTVLYELLTGCKAYPGETIDEVITAVLDGHCEPAHRVRKRVPRQLSAIAAKAMAHEPSQRYASAHELSRELRRWCERHAHLQHRSSAAARAAQGLLSAERPAQAPRHLPWGGRWLGLWMAGRASPAADASTPAAPQRARNRASPGRPSHRPLAAGATVLALVCASAAAWLALSPAPGGSAVTPAPQAMPARDDARG